MILTGCVIAALALAATWFLATQPFVQARPWAGGKASPERLERHVRVLSQVLPARGDDARALARAAEYVFDAFQRHGRPEYQKFSVSGVEYRNVVMRIGPGSGRTIVVGAHYDTWAGLPGADDNASGVAGLIELARLLAGASPRIDVELVAYALEEPPYFGTRDMGSWRHAEQSRAELAIVLEMIGYFRDEPGSQHYPLPLLRFAYSDRGDFIALIGRIREMRAVRTMKGAFLGAANVGTHVLTFPPIVPGVGLSDHSSYWASGIPAVMITDTAYERNPNYHTAQDTFDTLDYRRMAEVVTGVYASLFALAGDT
ncbi:MAG: M28 family peptidase [Gammaproteobacteria bacterium]|nr:M28 family peptidase [Gammaproteobacteria bacterium]